MSKFQLYKQGILTSLKLDEPHEQVKEVARLMARDHDTVYRVAMILKNDRLNEIIHLLGN